MPEYAWTAEHMPTRSDVGISYFVGPVQADRAGDGMIKADSEYNLPDEFPLQWRNPLELRHLFRRDTTILQYKMVLIPEIELPLNLSFPK